MVFHITNYMRVTNTWMIRKCRWMLWSFCGFIPAYRMFHWDYHSRRVAWKNWFDWRSEEEKQEWAEGQRANWGYHPRYEYKYEFSLKKRKYDAQTREESIRDTPRLFTVGSQDARHGKMRPQDVRTIQSIVKEHNRTPGEFDYNFPQNFYSTFPEIDQEAYVTVGGKARRKVD